MKICWGKCEEWINFFWNILWIFFLFFHTSLSKSNKSIFHLKKHNKYDRSFYVRVLIWSIISWVQKFPSYFLSLKERFGTKKWHFIQVSICFFFYNNSVFSIVHIFYGCYFYFKWSVINDRSWLKWNFST